MIHRALLAIIALSVCSTTVFAQDIFWSFSQGAVSPTSTVNLSDGTASAFVYVSSGFDFDGFDLDYANSDTSVIEITSGTVFNNELLVGAASLGRRFNTVAGQPVDIITGNLNLDPATAVTTTTPGPDGVLGTSDDVDVTTGTPDGTGGNLFGVAVSGAQGINTGLSGFDPGFDPGVGPDGSFLLAQVDFNIVGEGTANLTFSLGENGIIDLQEAGPDDDILLNPSFGTGFLTVTGIPEPSSAGLLVLGLTGIFARRRR